MSKTADKLEVGEMYEPLKLRTSEELNRQFMIALDDKDSRYETFVHPGILLNFTSITQSPSFCLEKSVAAVGAKFEAQYLRPTEIGKTLTFYWEVTGVYERRSRLYQKCDILVKDEDGREVLHRKITNTFIGGEYLERRVAWEKDKAYRRAVNISEFPKEGYEIGGVRKALTMEKMRLFSGGLPGINWPSRNIHTDREISIRSGVGRPIGSGLMFEAYITELMINFFGEGWFYNGEAKVIAIDMAGEGDVVVAKSVIKSRKDDARENKTVLDIWCENQFGNKIMIGTAKAFWNGEK